MKGIRLIDLIFLVSKNGWAITYFDWGYRAVRAEPYKIARFYEHSAITLVGVQLHNSFKLCDGQWGM